MNDPFLHRLLDTSLHLPPEYADQLTNHLPMALHALRGLGAADGRLQQFTDTYAARFGGQRAPPAAAPVADWQALRGQPQAFAPLRATFEAALAQHGVDAVLRQALPGLLTGVAAAAFHGLIRTAHAVEAGHPAELAAALAYWAGRWQPLEPPQHAARTAQPARLAFGDWSAAVADAAAGCAFDDRLIALRMRQAAVSAPYCRLAAALTPGPDLLPQLAGLAVRWYAATGNFTLLHTVTALRALRVLQPWVRWGADEAMIVVRAFTAAVLSAGIRPAAAADAELAANGWARQPAKPSASWPTVIALAVASNDDHVIKLVHACRAEAAVYGPGCYLEAAARATGW